MEFIQCKFDNAQTLATVVSTAWSAPDGDILSSGMPADDSAKQYAELLEGFYANGLLNNWFEAFFIVETSIRIGCCIAGRSKDADADFDVAEILGLYIIADYRCKSFGSKALSFIEARLRQQNYSKIKLWMLSDNMQPINFYRGHGYKLDGAKRKAVLGNEIMEIRFAKTL